MEGTACLKGYVTTMYRCSAKCWKDSGIMGQSFSSSSPMAAKVNGLLLELNKLYGEMGQKAATDYSEIRAYGNEILNRGETKDFQAYFQQDKGWFYRTEHHARSP